MLKLIWLWQLTIVSSSLSSSQGVLKYPLGVTCLLQRVEAVRKFYLWSTWWLEIVFHRGMLLLPLLQVRNTVEQERITCSEVHLSAFFKSLKRAHSSLAGSFSSLLFYNDDKESGEKAPGECDESDRRRGLRPPKQKLRPHSFAVGENCQPPIAGYKLKNSSSFLGINYFSLKYKLEYNYFIKLNS